MGLGLINEKVRRNLIFFFLFGFVESIVVIAAIFSIPPDSKSIFFLGFSRNRWIMVGGVFILGLVFLTGLLIVSLLRKRYSINSVFLRIKSSPKTPFTVEVIVLFFTTALILLIAFQRTLYLDKRIFLLPILVRINPILILSDLLLFQSLVVLLFLHAAINLQSWFESFKAIFSFPTIFIGPLKWISSLISKLLIQFDKVLDKLSRKVNRKLLIGLIFVAPIVITTTLLWLFFRASITEYMPTTSDEMVYWRETLTFISVGFEGGQYSTDELVAQANFSHFDAHGPAFPVFYGVLGKIFGWQLYTGILFNLLFFSFALIVFIYLTKPNNKQLILLLLTLITFWPIWLYLPTNRVEGLFFAIAIILTGLFYRIITKQKKPGVEAIFLFLLIMFAGFFRPSWSLLFIPYFGIIIRNFSFKNLTKIFIFTGLSIGVVILFFQYLVAPYPLFSYEFIHSLGSSEEDQFKSLAIHTLENIRSFFSFDDAEVFFLLRFQMVWVLIVSLVDSYQTFKNSVKSISFPKQLISLFNLSNLGITMVFTIIVHTIHAGREYRLWAPHFLLSLMILIFSSRQRIVLGIIITNLLFSVYFGSYFNSERIQNYNRDNSDILAFQEATSDFLVYEPGENHWCYTIDFSRYGNQITWGPWILTLPEEFGISWIINWENFKEQKLNAKFVLLDPVYIEEKEWLNVDEDLNLEFLTETQIGNLYLNMDSKCNQ